jgi:hypothetical protein
VSEEKTKPDVTIGQTPEGQVVAETPESAHAVPSSLTANWGPGLVGLLGDPVVRYGRLQLGLKVSMSTKVQMLADPTIGFCLAYIGTKLVRAEWVIECADETIRKFFEAMYGAFHREFMLQAAMAVVLGCCGLIKKLKFQVPQPLEVGGDPVWESAATPYICTGFRQVHPVGARPTWSKKAEFTGFEHRGGKVDRVYALWLTVGRARAFGSYGGMGRLDMAYKPWWLGEFNYDQLAVHMQKFVDRAVMVGYPPGKDSEGNLNRDKAISVGNSYRGGATVAMPTTVYKVPDLVTGGEKMTAVAKWWIKLMESTENMGAFLETADHLDSRKAMGLLVPFQMFQGVKQSALGGPTTADVLGTLAAAILVEDAVEIDGHLNEYVFPYLQRANFGEGRPPVTKRTVGLHEADRKELFELLKTWAGKANEEAGRELDIEGLAHYLGVPTRPGGAEVGENRAMPGGDDEAGEQVGAAVGLSRVYEAEGPEVGSPYDVSGHQGTVVASTCPFCPSEKGVQFEGHGNLVVCLGCGMTYAPEEHAPSSTGTEGLR